MFDGKVHSITAQSFEQRFKVIKAQIEVTTLQGYP